MEDKIEVKCYIPCDCLEYADSEYKGKDILKKEKNGIYRYYGIFLEGKQIGETLFSISFNDEVFKLTNIEIDRNYRDKGYGSILLEESINDLLIDYTYLSKVVLWSVPSAVYFYIKNGFKNYTKNILLKFLETRKKVVL